MAAVRKDQIWHDDIMLRDSSGKALLAEKWSCTLEPSDTGLYPVKRYPRRSNQDLGFFYVDYHGTIYADADVFE